MADYNSNNSDAAPTKNYLPRLAVPLHSKTGPTRTRRRRKPIKSILRSTPRAHGRISWRNTSGDLANTSNGPSYPAPLPRIREELATPFSHLVPGRWKSNNRVATNSRKSQKVNESNGNYRRAYNIANAAQIRQHREQYVTPPPAADPIAAMMENMIGNHSL